MKIKIEISIILIAINLVLLTGCSEKSYFSTENDVYSYLKEEFPEGNFKIISMESEKIDAGITCPDSIYKYSVKSLDNNVTFTVKDKLGGSEWCINSQYNDFLYSTVSSSISDSRIIVNDNWLFIKISLKDFNSVGEMANILYNNIQVIKNKYPFNTGKYNFPIIIYRNDDDTTLTSLELKLYDISSENYIVDFVNNN